MVLSSYIHTSWFTSAKSQELFGKGVQGNPPAGVPGVSPGFPLFLKGRLKMHYLPGFGEENLHSEPGTRLSVGYLAGPSFRG
jgi:hypothetical protein